MSRDPFRWKTADDAEPALFGMDDLLLPERGTGRMSDLEFLHVTAKRILNRVPSRSRAPFDWTINVYRGCSHACEYCLEGSTPILMADGRTKRLEDIRPGEHLYGTQRRGAYRRYVVTEVLAHWRTTKPAYRIRLEDGTELIASGDHRFLTERGWKFVSPAVRPEQRPFLTTNNALMGLGRGGLRQRLRFFQLTDPATTRKRTIDGVAVKSNARLRVMAVEPLGFELPMYDITTGTGDFIADGVISHNCFARPTHEYLGLNAGEDFDRKIVVKINAVEKLRAELADPKWQGEGVAMGTNTDPYQRAEAKYRLTRGVLEALTERANPFSILTKSPLVTRDLDVLTEAANRTQISVNFSVGTLDERVWRLTEPGSPNPRRRIEAMAELSEAGISTGALVAPVLPGLSDRPEQLREVVQAIRDAGGRLLGLGPLHLRPGVREHFLGWLAEADPDLHADYLRRYANTDYAPQRYLETLRARAGLPARSPTRPRTAEEEP